MPDLVLVAIFKNESNVLEEWIKHYMSEGVDHFFLIDNGSSDNYKTILLPYIKSGIVDLVIDTTRHAQKRLYNKHFLKLCKDSSWVIVADFDEFIYSRNNYNKVIDYLESLPENIGQIYIPWKVFGSSGYETQPSSVVHNFNKRAIYNGKINQGMISEKIGLCKTIIRSKYLKKIGIHFSNVKKCAEITSDNKPIIKTKLFHRRKKIFQQISEESLENSCLHLNHYAIQSLEWFKKVKVTRGAADCAKSETVRDLEYFESFDYNDLFDSELANKNYGQ
jgi:hypothetical protein